MQLSEKHPVQFDADRVTAHIYESGSIYRAHLADPVEDHDRHLDDMDAVLSRDWGNLRWEALDT